MEWFILAQVRQQRKQVLALWMLKLRFKARRPGVTGRRNSTDICGHPTCRSTFEPVTFANHCALVIRRERDGRAVTNRVTNRGLTVRQYLPAPQGRTQWTSEGGKSGLRDSWATAAPLGWVCSTGCIRNKEHCPTWQPGGEQRCSHLPIANLPPPIHRVS